jgi:hypothetical protein
MLEMLSVWSPFLLRSDLRSPLGVSRMVMVPPFREVDCRQDRDT